eukprot:5934921-Pyramimonas_sp.AAC.1
MRGGGRRTNVTRPSRNTASAGGAGDGSLDLSSSLCRKGEGRRGGGQHRVVSGDPTAAGARRSLPASDRVVSGDPTAAGARRAFPALERDRFAARRTRRCSPTHCWRANGRAGRNEAGALRELELSV